PNAVPEGDGLANFKPLGIAGQATHLSLVSTASVDSNAAPTSVSFFDQGIVQVLQASVTGLSPKSQYVLALSTKPDGAGPLEPLQAFVTNPAGAAIVNTVGPVRQVVKPDAPAEQKYLIIAEGTADQIGKVVQVQQS